MEITYRGTIYPWQCDHMAHMNVMWYTGKFDEASWQFLSHLGLTRSVLRDRNCALAAVQQNITYKRELHAGDIITIRSSIHEIGEKSITFVHEMQNDETLEIAAIAMVTGVHMDASARRACPFPENVRRRAWELIEKNGRLSLSEERSVSDLSLPLVFSNGCDPVITQ